MASFDATNSPQSIPSSSSQVILHDPSKQKIVLYDPRSQQITLCEGRWYNNIHNNFSAFFQQHGYFNFTSESSSNINTQFCPMCLQRLPNKSAPTSLTYNYCDTMHRDYFMLLDRAHATDSRRSNDSFNTQHNNLMNDDEIKPVSQDALNSGYYSKFFENVKKLGSGSYGTVHLVKHVMHDICLGYFAIKIIPVGDQLPRLIEILREVRALQRLHHRNVIDYKHSWLEDYQGAINGPLVPCLFILMEYADFGNVMDYIIAEDEDNNQSKRKWLSEHEIWTIMFETCMGLQHLHEYGIVHRDLKPGNLLMTSLHTRHRIDFEDLELYDTNYRIVLSDLGQSEFLDAHQRKPRTGNTGTLGFAAPELILNNINEWDESVDVWSLGHILYFLTFSEWPYDDLLNIEDEKEFYQGIVNGTYKLSTDRKHNGFRSHTMIQMIDELCCINVVQRPSLNWIINSISNILKSHQYITINSMDGNSKALLAPKNETDLALYPVIQYVPKNNKLRRRKRNIKKQIAAKQIEVKQIEITIKQRILWLMKNGTIQMAMHLMIKMQFIVIVFDAAACIKMLIYCGVCCILLSLMFHSKSNDINMKYVFVVYGVLSCALCLVATYLQWQHGDIVTRVWMLFAAETLLFSVCAKYFKNLQLNFKD